MPLISNSDRSRCLTRTATEPDGSLRRRDGRRVRRNGGQYVITTQPSNEPPVVLPP